MMGNRIGDNIGVIAHPDLHGEFLDQFFRNWILSNLVIRNDGSVGTVGGWWLWASVRGQGVTNDAVASVSTDTEIKSIRLSLFATDGCRIDVMFLSYNSKVQGVVVERTDILHPILQPLPVR